MFSVNHCTLHFTKHETESENGVFAKRHQNFKLQKRILSQVHKAQTVSHNTFVELENLEGSCLSPSKLVMPYLLRAVGT